MRKIKAVVETIIIRKDDLPETKNLICELCNNCICCGEPVRKILKRGRFNKVYFKFQHLDCYELGYLEKDKDDVYPD